jgi:hypothetical protein
VLDSPRQTLENGGPRFPRQPLFCSPNVLDLASGFMHFANPYPS